jgi:hypothetical protein
LGADGASLLAAIHQRTERIHPGHLRRLLDTTLYLSEVTSKTLQAYVTTRAAAVESETVRKEVGTFIPCGTGGRFHRG